MLARAAHDLRGGTTTPKLIVRFLGATPASSDLASLLQGLCRQIDDRLGFEEARRTALARAAAEEQSPDETVRADARRQRLEIERTYAIPHRYGQVAETFRRFLALTPPDRPSVLMLDGLDQPVCLDARGPLD